MRRLAPRGGLTWPVPMIAPPGICTAGGRKVTLTIRRLLLLIAVILFALAAFGVDVRGLSFVAAGLALFAASFLAPDTVVGRRV
jgi:hypothetical protein